MHRRGKDPGRMLSRVRGFAILGKLVRVCATIVRAPIFSPQRHGSHHSRLRRRWAVDRDEICKEGNHHQECGSTQFVDYCSWTMLTHNLIGTRGGVPLRLPVGIVTYCTWSGRFSGLKGRCGWCEIRHFGRASTSTEYERLGAVQDCDKAGWPYVIRPRNRTVERQLTTFVVKKILLRTNTVSTEPQ